MAKTKTILFCMKFYIFHKRNNVFFTTSEFKSLKEKSQLTKGKKYFIECLLLH